MGGLFPDHDHYVDTYHRYGLVGRHSVLAHNVHPSDAELEVFAAADASVAHCPSSNSALGSGLFPLRRHVEHGVGVALGTDVGAGTSFSLLREGLQAYFMQALLGAEGLPLAPAHMLYLATRAGAEALGLADEVGDLSVGRQFDAVWVAPDEDTTLARVLGHAADAEDALAKVFALAGPGDVAGSGSAATGCVDDGHRRQLEFAQWKINSARRKGCLGCQPLGSRSTARSCSRRSRCWSGPPPPGRRASTPWSSGGRGRSPCPVTPRSTGSSRPSRDAGVQLIGLNFAAGDMPGGDRGLVSWPARSAEFRDNVDVTVGIGEQLGCRAFNALYGNRVGDDATTAEQQDELAAENLAIAARAAKRVEGTVLVEPVSGAPRYPLRTAAEALAAIDRVGEGNVRLLFDVYHLAVNGDDVDAAIDVAAGRIGHVQIADAPGRHQPGTGELPIAR